MPTLKKHQYSNTIGSDLWDALGQASGRDVAAFMDSWLEQPGYPVLTVKVENDVLKISQNNSSSVRTKTRTVSGWCPSIATGKACLIHSKLKVSKSLATQLFLLKMKELFVSTLKILPTILPTIKETC